MANGRSVESEGEERREPAKNEDRKNEPVPAACQRAETAELFGSAADTGLMVSREAIVAKKMMKSARPIAAPIVRPADI